jgi:arginase
MMQMAVALLGAPIGLGAGRRGAEAGPHALRMAGLRKAVAQAGRAVHDFGDLTPHPAPARFATLAHPNRALKHLAEVAAWTEALHVAARAIPADRIPLFMGGDHSLSLGTLTGLAERARMQGRPFFVLWIDAHPDCHTLDTSTSGHLHGTPIAYALGENGFSPAFRPMACPIPAANLLMLGIRDVDPAEAALIRRRGLAAHAPAALRRSGLSAILSPWLERIRAENGLLHVSLDADALDPALAPGVGTPVADGLTLDEASQALGLVAEAGVLGSLDLVEVNPFLDREQRTARAMVALAAKALATAGAATAAVSSNRTERA